MDQCGSFLHGAACPSAPCAFQSNSTTFCVLQQQGLEKYLMTKLYSKVFAASQSDRERDEALAQRMEVRVLQHASHQRCSARHACGTTK